MRKISKVVFCDALSETPMEKGYEGPYDIILQFGCLEAACSTKKNYESCMKTLTTLLKPDGVMINTATNGLIDYEGLRYCVGDTEHTCLRFTSEYVASVFSESGLKDVKTTIIPLCQSWLGKQVSSTANGLHFITGTKM